MLSVERNTNHGNDCSTTSERCTTARMFARDDMTKMKNAARKCTHCHKHNHKAAIEKHYLKSHKEHFTWIECKLCRKEHREEIFKDHIRGHNRYVRDEYYMKPEELEELLKTGRYDAALTAVGEHEKKQREFNRQHFELGRHFGTT